MKQLISDSHQSLFEHTYCYHWRLIYAKLVKENMLERWCMPFSQRQQVVMLHLLFGQAYASDDSKWTPANRACFHLTCMFFEPTMLAAANVEGGRTHPYHSSTSTTATASAHKNLQGKASLWKHMLEHLALEYEQVSKLFEKPVPLVVLSECNLDQVLGRVQDLLRARSGHTKWAIVNVLELLETDAVNETEFAVRQTERGEKNSRKKRMAKEMGSVDVRPLVFGPDIADKLPFEQLEAQLKNFKLDHLLTRHVIDEDIEVRTLNVPTRITVNRQNLRAAYKSKDIWFFCLCAGPDHHDAPCVMAPDAEE